LKKTGGVSLLYATQFQIEEYGVYKMITIGDERFLLVPDGEEAVANLPADVTMLRQPKKAYVVSTSVMDLLQAIDALDDVRLSGTKQEDWYIQAAKDAMADGDMLYAGKYNQPDYEKIISENCDLAIENTMILHNPEVKEKLEALGIPVLVERSSYETHPLGRLEWIRLYGVLFGKEEQADAFYQEQVAKVEPIMKKDATDQTMAFFYVTSNGSVNVRKPGDYIAKMIQLAGGSYLPQAVKEDDENALSTMNMQMEDFYAQAKDADILIYNSTIEGELDSVDTLLAKSPLFADFKAVKEGKVYCTTADFFQETTGIASFIEDLHAVMTGDTSHELKYLKEVK
jgi:iron complex transport system substrate-binding protein